MDTMTTVRRLAAQDRNRPSFRGEHWLVLGAGLALLGLSARGRSPLLRGLARTLGTGLLARAASGRDGLRRLWG